MTRHAVIVSPSPGSRDGGVERFCAQVGDVLQHDGWTVEEVGPGPWPQGRWAARLGLVPLQAARRSGRAARGRGADLVVSNGSLGWGAPPGVPRIHVFHGTMPHHVWNGEASVLPRRELVRRMASFGVAEALSARGAATVAVIERIVREVRQVYRRRIDAVIPLAVDTERFAPRDRGEARRRLGLPGDVPLALYVGRVEVRKGGDLLLPATAAAGMRLAVAGAGAPEGALALGQLDHETLPWAYAAADVVFHPSRYEGSGYVPIEAVVSERLLVSTHTGWAAELPGIVPGYERFLVEPERDALAAALRDALAGGHDALLREAAVRVRQEHALDRFAERWAALVDRVTLSA